MYFPFGFFPGFPRMLCIRAGGFQPPGQKHSGGKSFLMKEVQEGRSALKMIQWIIFSEGRVVTP